jgi:hypothetical protein
MERPETFRGWETLSVTESSPCLPSWLIGRDGKTTRLPGEPGMSESGQGEMWLGARERCCPHV